MRSAFGAYDEPQIETAKICAEKSEANAFIPAANSPGPAARQRRNCQQDHQQNCQAGKLFEY
jgi:hypothetical protein